MDEQEILSKIEKLTRKRKKAWATGQPVDGMGQELERLYAELRLARARHHNGDRKTIKKRARAELSLEKLYEEM